MVLANVSEVVPFAKSGKMRSLAVTTAERAEAMPDVPTMREVGYPESNRRTGAGSSCRPRRRVRDFTLERRAGAGAAQRRDTGKLKTYGMSPARARRNSSAHYAVRVGEIRKIRA